MTHTPAPSSSLRPAVVQLRPWMSALAGVLIGLGLLGVLGAVLLWFSALENDDPLAGLGFVFAALLVLWTCVPAILGVLVLVLGRRWPGASRVMVWVGLAWHGLWLLLAAGMFLPGFASV
ncbi:MAG: hypothetical protein ACI379_13150 [Nocardioides sp.]|uniref:hypothetical protein n=1 Tax=Nocardioides sp. TaxID=35761 RepID=UPI003F094C3B